MYVYIQYLYFRCKRCKLHAHMNTAVVSYHGGAMTPGRARSCWMGWPSGCLAMRLLPPRHVAAGAEVTPLLVRPPQLSTGPQPLAFHFESKNENRVASQTSPRCRRPGRGSCLSPGNSRTCLDRAVVCLLWPAGPSVTRLGWRPPWHQLPP